MTTSKKRIAIVSDAYYPQVSGVARTLEATKDCLEKRGHVVLIVSPRDFRFKVPLPTYPEIKLAVANPYRRLKKMLQEFRPDAVHIAVEGPLGLAARKYCKRRGLKFSTAYHTRFPEYIHVRTKLPLKWSYAFIRWFHNAADSVMVTSENLKKELEAWGIRNIVLWERGVDTERFHPVQKYPEEKSERVFMYMGRVAPEKNLDAFLKLDLPGKKYIVGDGPDRVRLEGDFPDAVFTGYKFGEELAGYLAMADVFVFPSLTDTFGLVMLEANACGTPVAALPSQASKTVIKQGENGIISKDLRAACLEALKLSREECREHALALGWQKPTDMFEKHLASA